MSDLPREAAQGIAAARPGAEAELRKALGALTDALGAWLPAFKKHAAALFDGGAEGAAVLFRDPIEFERFLEETLLSEVVEGIMPDRSLRETLAGEEAPHRALVVEDDGQVYEAERYEAGERTPAPRAAQVPFAIHGDLERFLSEAGFRSKLFPDEKEQVRRALTAHLRQRVFYWAGRLEESQAASRRPQLATPESPGKVIAALRAKYRMTRKSLASRAGINRDTLRKIDHGKPVRQEKISAVVEVFTDLGEASLNYQSLLPK